MSYILLICFLILTCCAIITTVCAIKDSDLFNNKLLEDIDSEYDKFIVINDVVKQTVYISMYTILAIYIEKENDVVILTEKRTYIEHYSCQEEADDRLIELLNILRLFY